MSLPFRESHDFVFNGRAVSRALSHYLSSIERRTVHILPDYLMGLFIGESYPTVQGRPLALIAIEGERKHFLVSVLHFQFIKVQRALPDSGRRTCLHPS